MRAGNGKTPRSGAGVESASELTLFFRVIPGHGDAIRAAIRSLHQRPGFRPGDFDMPIASTHEARFVLFDDDTRLLFATSYDGSWDAYMEDFALSPLTAFHAIFFHTVGYHGLPNVAAIKELVLSAQVTADGYARNYPGSVKEIRKAGRVNAALRRILDDPAATDALQHPALQPLLDEVAT